MAKSRHRKASRVLVALMVTALLFVACENVFIGASAAESFGTTLYLKTDNTTDPYVHYWVDGNSSNSSNWPGVKMEKMGGETNVYQYNLPCDVSELTGVIFLNGGGGDKMTGDVTGITGNMYTLDGSSGKWGMYDTSAIKIKDYGSDLQSPQYINSKINLFINAESANGGVQYKISVSGAKDEVLKDYSADNSVVWTPTVAGDYTVLYEVTDAAGEKNSRQADFKIKDSANAEEPIFLGATPANNAQIQKGGVTTVKVNGAGGQLNTKLLFYKTEVIDPDGNPVNTVYYQLGNRLSFTADKLGVYTVKMSIQNSSVKNTTVTQTYTYNSVNDVIDTDTESDTDVTVRVTGVTLDKTKVDLTEGQTAELKATVNPSNATDKSVKWSSSDPSVATVSNGTVKAVKAGTATITVTTVDGGYKAECTVTVKQAASDTDIVSDTDTNTDTDTDYTFILGDVDGNGKVTLKDASLVQQNVLGIGSFNLRQEKAADANRDGKISMKDASLIQQATLGIAVLDEVDW